MTHKIRPIHLVVSVLVVVYMTTTGIGAAIFPFQFGREQLAAFLYPQPVQLDWMTSLGSPFYWALLLAMLVVTPITAFVTERATRRAISNVRLPDIPTWIPMALAGAMVAFCIYKLARADALSAYEMWDRSFCYRGRVLRRVELFELLGTRHYCFAYSSLPILGCYLLAQGIRQRDTLALLGFAGVSAAILWFDVAMMMKAPAVIYIGTLGLTLGLSGFGVVRSALVTASIAVIVYVGLSALQFCAAETVPWERTVPCVMNAPDPSYVAPPLRVPTSRDASPSSQPPGDQSQSTIARESGKPFIYKVLFVVRVVLFRMAAGFPYYVQMFAEPHERCGIELPPMRWLPNQVCFGPIKVFRRMHPRFEYTVGFQPGPVNASAYGEAGPWYALAAMVACGLILGTLAALARGYDPLSIAITVACCIYAYYVAQTSLTGSLIDSYGLLWLMIPLILMVTINACCSKLWKTNS